jgi:predicted nicotinamide N-methyase
MQQIHPLVQGDMSIDEYYSAFDHLMSVDVSYAAPQAHGIVNVVLHREYTPGIVFIFSQGRKDLYHV